MKRILYTAAVLCMSVLATQCTKDMEELQEAGGQESETIDSFMEMTPDGGVFMQMGVSGGASTRTSISGTTSEGTRSVSWKTGDLIYVVASGDGCLGSLAASTDGHTAKFTGTIASWEGEQTLHYYYVGMGTGKSIENEAKTFTYSVASQKGDLEDVAENLQLMHASAGSMTAGSHKLAGLTMGNMMALAWFDLTTSTGFDAAQAATLTGAYSSATLDLTSGTFSEKTAGDITLEAGTLGESYYVALIPGSQAMSFKQGGTTHICNASTAVAAGEFRTSGGKAIVVNAKPAILNGVFSVSATKKVQFSRGNLYYSTTDSKYHIEDQQNVTYLTLGQSKYDATHVCHFFWSNTNDWQTSGREPWAQNSNPLTPSTTDKFFCGIDNPMTVDGQSGLYALTGGESGEWYYLFNSRTNASNLYKKSVTVTTSAGTAENCVVIAPDGYTGTIASSYDAEAWAIAEKSGLVCLPAAGCREVSTLSCTNGFGSYWSSSPYREWTAYDIQFWSSSLYWTNYNNRDGGYSVRLVTDYSEPEGPVLLDGVFSVAPGKRVQFSRGNLQATKSDTGAVTANGDNDSKWDFSFAAHQYDYVGSGNKTSTGGLGDKIDLFAWSSNESGAYLYGISTVKNDSFYGSSTEASTFNDWGGISGLPSVAGRTWSTLTEAEWGYLLKTRTVNSGTGDGKSYQRTTLTLSDASTVYGLVIVPDGYSGTLATATSWSDWQTMESDGCVFLPAGGYWNNNTELEASNTQGRYWSATPQSSSYAYNLLFEKGNVDPDDPNNRCISRSVRLVSEYSDQGVTIDGVTWATYNLGTDADHPYGLLYQYGRKYGQGYYDATYSPNETTPTLTATQATSYDDGNSSANSDTFYKVGNDKFWHTGTWSYVWGGDPIADDSNPCPDGWTIPTAAQFESLYTNMTSLKTVNGLRGFYLSGGTKYGTGVPSVFFPLAGKRDYSGSTMYRGADNNSGVLVWSSTSYSSGSKNKIMSIFIDSNKDVRNKIDTFHPNQGLSVRCVKK